MITFFVLLVLLMVLVAVGIPALSGGWTSRRVIVDRRPEVIEEVVDDDVPLRPVARRRVVRRRTY